MSVGEESTLYGWIHIATEVGHFILSVMMKVSTLRKKKKAQMSRGSPGESSPPPTSNHQPRWETQRELLMGV